MKIAFFHNGISFLPEIEAYIDYFNKRNIESFVVQPHQSSVPDFDVEWHFMGTGKRRKKSSVLIHEYGSLSVPPFAHIKNFLKKTINEIPDYRLFLNEAIKKQMNFNDHIPFGFRDMGVDLSWRTNECIEKKYDFIYIGSIAKNRKLEKLLTFFTKGSLQESSLLILSDGYRNLEQQFSSYPNISFKGPATRIEVLHYIQSAQFGLNYIPNNYPFNIQTSTKFLEYCQAMLPVVTTDYEWVRTFQNHYGGNYFYLKHDLSNFQKDQLEIFPFAFPDLTNWSWDQQINGSGIADFLLNK